ncbi:MAG: tryptophan--tRNA ligase [Burkholderiales bacterium]|jgi:tryptophanyl-tRNA synthetase|uniref:Tryptophan--tRNA ligase n=1 Tax=Candidatus Desulfobacillus denitrificans TaxID=2608985 RepID=A0A809S4D2_9PROT|nr:tryptophan--tRNA ligase [Zoogloeaceae bacterium]MBP9654120.1 tryptophan--tRNA ligase [Rhodocyclaceae bacterium]MCZ2173650.1 tryptophan--tRNA ligase [Burkholderiales bacterium]OQY75749.1 MAG: tryptophan--tRNA ligase [Rhodocyclaceae bacterium UTPRO2]BBO20541.1 tryptophan--tRNA ligase [Candidatus Desulfobacillus denitrificans]GIK44109.1 MAG: tryptophan--tRNA ligase [Betaproteobacteria bacterium]
MYAERVLSGMRPTGRLHLGHYHGVLKNWVKLQNEYPCLFFVADWHALTTAYDEPGTIEENTWEMVIDWLAAGVDPAQATLFIQSRVLEHAELHLLLSMMTPLSWLERVPTYKDQQEKLEHKDLSTYGFLGYPLLQSADILIYRANRVPVGEDQVPHIEFSREIARRFNHLYGREPDFEAKARAAVKLLGAKRAREYEELRTRFQQEGDHPARERARVLIEEAQNLSHEDRERLFGFLDGTSKMILVEPGALLTEAAKMPGLDGRKMSKSYNNTILLRESADSVTKKIRTMQTDPARVRRTDPGEPERCPVWQFHLVYSDEATKQWVQQGCRSAGIGCIECKHPVIDAVLKEQEPMHERAQAYIDDPALVRNIIADGCTRARQLAGETMRDVREAMGLNYT